MASITDAGDVLHDPEAMLQEREALALRNMNALISIAEGSKDDRARVSAAAELNKMLSLGLTNRTGGTIRATQVNNNLRLSGAKADDATARLLDKFSPEGREETHQMAAQAIRQMSVEETLDALREDADD
jgi:hypothetical protein